MKFIVSMNFDGHVLTSHGPFDSGEDAVAWIDAARKTVSTWENASHWSFDYSTIHDPTEELR